MHNPHHGANRGHFRPTPGVDIWLRREALKADNAIRTMENDVRRARNLEDGLRALRNRAPISACARAANPNLGSQLSGAQRRAETHLLDIAESTGDRLTVPQLHLCMRLAAGHAPAVHRKLSALLRRKAPPPPPKS